MLRVHAEDVCSFLKQKLHFRSQLKKKKKKIPDRFPLVAPPPPAFCDLGALKNVAGTEEAIIFASLSA